jgi:SET domain-containing protein
MAADCTIAFLAGCRVGSSRIHGLGLYTGTAIPRRRKLGELSGTLRRLPLARQEHQRREVIQLVEFSRRWALDLTDGNAFRHLNHSCRANCYLRVIGRRIEVYSRGAIPAGSELTVDYGETMHRGGMACACGAPRCRSRI